MDERVLITFLVSENSLSDKLVECIQKQNRKANNKPIEIHSLFPPYKHLIQTYQRRLKLGQERGQDIKLLQQLKNIITFLRQNKTGRYMWWLLTVNNKQIHFLLEHVIIN